jgi:hypothetical protein
LWTGWWFGTFFSVSCGAQPEQRQEQPRHYQDVSKGARLQPQPQANEAYATNSNACSYYLVATEFANIKFTDLLLVIFTIVLAWKTAGLDRATRGLQKLGVRQSRDMQRSLKNGELSTKAFVRVELPWIGMSTPQLIDLNRDITDLEFGGGGFVANAPGKYSIVPNLFFDNIGRTPARLHGIEWGWFAGPKLPNIPQYQRHKNLAGDSIQEKTFTKQIILDRYTINLTDDNIVNIVDGKETLWFYVKLHYSDFMGDLHHSGHCWKWATPDIFGVFGFVADQYSPAKYRQRE